jgi:hypothetical protein
MSEETKQEPLFERLSKIDVNKFTEKKNGANLPFVGSRMEAVQAARSRCDLRDSESRVWFGVPPMRNGDYDLYESIRRRRDA